MTEFNMKTEAKISTEFQQGMNYADIKCKLCLCLQLIKSRI